MTGIKRLFVWISEVVLTCAIMLYPTHLRYEYHLVQSTYIFDNLPLFAVIFIVWLGLLLLLLFTIKGNTKGNWEGLAVVVIFTLVFLGFWGILAPERQPDGIWNLSTAGYILSSGTISSHVNVGYLDFPGIHILTATLSQVTGFSILHSATVLLIVFSLLLAVMLYLLFSKTTEDPRLAGFAVLLAIQGNWTQSLFAFFWPRYIGLIFLAVFLVLLNRKTNSVLGAQQDRIAMIILLGAVTVSYFVTSLTFFFILLGIYLVLWVSRPRFRAGEIVMSSPGTTVDWSIIVICLIVPIVWETYYAINFLSGIALWVPNFLEDLSGGKLFSKVFQVASVNLGEAVPLWAKMTRLFWLFFIYGFGFILALVSLFRLRKLDSAQKVAIGGLIGVMIVGIIGLLISPGGVEGQRMLMYAPLFLLPLLIWYFSKLKERVRNYAFILIPLIFFALSFPTFLAHNNRINTDAYYPYDYASGEFMESRFGSGKGLNIFSLGDTTLPIIYAGVRDSNYYGTWEIIKNETDMWQQIDSLTTNWGNTQGQHNMFILSQRGMGCFELWGVKLADPRWSQLEQSLLNDNRIYDSSYVRIYEKE